jgi:hypothetical protein
LTGNPDWSVTAFDALLVAMFLLQLFECGVLLYICSLLRGAQRYANEAIDATVIGVEQLHPADPQKNWGIPMDGR